MKKIIIVFAVLAFLYSLTASDEIKIPNLSIRFRIIAASNSFSDQQVKQTIKKDLINNIIPNLLTTKSIDESRTLINKSITEIDKILKKYGVNYTINFGNNYFPEKIYNGILYPKGNYESLVVTLGDGLGDNWWCVLYPPLCLIEENYSNEGVIMRSYIKDVILKSNHL